MHPIVPIPRAGNRTEEATIAGLRWSLQEPHWFPARTWCTAVRTSIPASERFLFLQRFLGRRFEPYEYFPFGGGCEAAVAEPLAQLEFKAAIQSILEWWVFRKPPQALLSNRLAPSRTLLAPPTIRPWWFTHAYQAKRHALSIMEPVYLTSRRAPAGTANAWLTLFEVMVYVTDRLRFADRRSRPGDCRAFAAAGGSR